MIYRIKLVNEEYGKKLCRENRLVKLIKFYEGRGQFNKGKLMMEIDLLEDSKEKNYYVYKRADGMYVGENSFGTPYRSQARVYELTLKEAIIKLNKLNADNGATWILEKV